MASTLSYSFLKQRQVIFDYKFITEPDDSLKCCICLEVARGPKQEEGCGKLFCSDCIRRWPCACPNCRNYPPRYFSDKRSHREIQALGVRCDNVERGCDWEGMVGTLEDHVTRCGFTLVRCPNGCNLCLLQKDLFIHLPLQCLEREYICKECGIIDKYRVISGPHELACLKKIVICPNSGCGAFLQRGLVQGHMQQSCDYSEVYCRYASIGCEEKMIRKEIIEHEDNTEHHFPIALNKILELNIMMAKKSYSGSRFGSFGEGGQQITFKLAKYSEEKACSLEYCFEPFFTSPTGYKICFFIYLNGGGEGVGTHISVFIKILHGPYDDQLEWPFCGVFKVELLNQLADCNHHSMSIPYSKANNHQPGENGLGYNVFIDQSKLTFDSFRNVCYLKDDVLFFRVTSSVTGYKSWLEHTHQ